MIVCVILLMDVCYIPCKVLQARLLILPPGDTKKEDDFWKQGGTFFRDCVTWEIWKTVQNR